MPTGPQGQKRPADATGAAIMVAKLATGEIKENSVKKSGGVRSGNAAAKARAANLAPADRKAIAQKAASKRWER